jgi:hypothetical protein
VEKALISVEKAVENFWQNKLKIIFFLIFIMIFTQKINEIKYRLLL